MLSQDHRDSPLVAGHLLALPHHKLDQPSTPHQQAAVLDTAQHLQQNSSCMTDLHMNALAQQPVFLNVTLAAAAAFEQLCLIQSL